LAEAIRSTAVFYDGPVAPGGGRTLAERKPACSDHPNPNLGSEGQPI
jgi:hypothetical protein